MDLAAAAWTVVRLGDPQALRAFLTQWLPRTDRYFEGPGRADFTANAEALMLRDGNGATRPKSYFVEGWCPTIGGAAELTVGRASDDGDRGLTRRSAP